MTAEIVNLNKVRKAKARAEKERRAEENRAKHGRTMGQRRSEDMDKARAKRELDGAQRGTADRADERDD